ncbi:hypothetical protein UFOVP236_59 [uncultured Caudovirales phage]|uniref:Uncharacterized protein n=1 Tax=uncultured Caudovirales phage TaxID=2100421 RepID=A0A6J7WRT7_9CAUD|nr:hypothetical protein UFOVP236_59 [uncultured Caudovirales phage]
MTVQEMINQLQSLPKDIDVYVWDAGNRVSIAMVDDAFIHDEYPFVDINTTTDD